MLQDRQDRGMAKLQKELQIEAEKSAFEVGDRVVVDVTEGEEPPTKAVNVPSEILATTPVTGGSAEAVSYEDEEVSSTSSSSLTNRGSVNDAFDLKSRHKKASQARMAGIEVILDLLKEACIGIDKGSEVAPPPIPSAEFLCGTIHADRCENSADCGKDPQAVCVMNDAAIEEYLRNEYSRDEMSGEISLPPTPSNSPVAAVFEERMFLVQIPKEATKGARLDVVVDGKPYSTTWDGQISQERPGDPNIKGLFLAKLRVEKPVEDLPPTPESSNSPPPTPSAFDALGSKEKSLVIAKKKDALKQIRDVQKCAATMHTTPTKQGIQTALTTYPAKISEKLDVFEEGLKEELLNLASLSAKQMNVIVSFVCGCDLDDKGTTLCVHGSVQKFVYEEPTNLERDLMVKLSEHSPMVRNTLLCDENSESSLYKGKYVGFVEEKTGENFKVRLDRKLESDSENTYLCNVQAEKLSRPQPHKFFVNDRVIVKNHEEGETTPKYCPSMLPGQVRGDHYGDTVSVEYGVYDPILGLRGALMTFGNEEDVKKTRLIDVHIDDEIMLSDSNHVLKKYKIIDVSRDPSPTDPEIQILIKARACGSKKLKIGSCNWDGEDVDVRGAQVKQMMNLERLARFEKNDRIFANFCGEMLCRNSDTNEIEPCGTDTRDCT